MKFWGRHGQSILEYTMIVSILVVVLYYMGTGIKRGVQSLVKITADQIGNQQNADQDFNDTQEGYLVSSNTVTQENLAHESTETGYINSSGTVIYVGNTIYNESTDTVDNSITNGGFSPNG